MVTIPTLYTNSEDCCGCMACLNVCPKNAISVTNDINGFTFPKINVDLCIRCQKCIDVCDFKKTESEEIQRFQPLSSWAAVNKNTKDLKYSSSGGVFPALSEWVLSNKGYVVGCIMDEDFTPKHICSGLECDINQMRGSKYVQSEVGYIYREIKNKLQSGRVVLFTGTPCQCAGLYQYLGGKTKYENLITMDVICHGVPNVVNLKKYLKFLSNREEGTIRSVNFRSKSNGWGVSYAQVQIEKDGKIADYYFGRNEEYFIDFLSGYLKRDSDFVCKYASTYRVSDITVGDFWGWLNADIKLSWGKGLSLIYINTHKAENILNSLNLNLQKVDMIKTLENPALRGTINTHSNKTREEVLQLYRENNLLKRYPSRNWQNKIYHWVKYNIPFPWVITCKQYMKRLLKN